jgi:hypothetical protein
MPVRSPLTEHELAVQDLLIRLGGVVQGFPENDFALENITRAWAKFMVLEPYRLEWDSGYQPTEEDLARFGWKEGVIPGEWLIEKISDCCHFMPSAIEAREIYCDGGFTPRDGRYMDKLSLPGWRRAAVPKDEEE